MYVKTIFSEWNRRQKKLDNWINNSNEWRKRETQSIERIKWNKKQWHEMAPKVIQTISQTRAANGFKPAKKNGILFMFDCMLIKNVRFTICHNPEIVTLINEWEVLSLNTRFECWIFRSAEVNKQRNLSIVVGHLVYLCVHIEYERLPAKTKGEKEDFISNFTADKNFSIYAMFPVYVPHTFLFFQSWYCVELLVKCNIGSHHHRAYRIAFGWIFKYINCWGSYYCNLYAVQFHLFHLLTLGQFQTFHLDVIIHLIFIFFIFIC